MDHNATTPVDARVLKAMLPFFCEDFGNAASIDHLYGAEANQAVNLAREQVASLIGGDAEEIIFTSGATEANNLALLGVAQGLESKGKHIITCVTEHHAVLDVCKHLQAHGWEVTYLPVDNWGLIDPEAVKNSIRADTVLISIMTANNEIGTIAPIAEIGHIARERDVLFHTDATQAVGYVPINVDKNGIDLMSMSAHKMYGPKGVGALYVRKRRPRIRIVEQIHGGGHERGMRSGTLNVPGIVGFGAATAIVMQDWKCETARLTQLRDAMWELLSASNLRIHRNGHSEKCLPHTLSISIDGIESRALVGRLKHVLSFSTGAACTTSTVEPSHVIVAVGGTAQAAFSTIRLGLGRVNTDDDVRFAVSAITGACYSMHRLTTSI